MRNIQKIDHEPFGKVRKEAHTRCTFAYERSLFYFKKVSDQFIRDQGNILSCKNTIKFLQARRIYVHYTNEYQNNFRLPLLK